MTLNHFVKMKLLYINNVLKEGWDHCYHTSVTDILLFVLSSSFLHLFHFTTTTHNFFEWFLICVIFTDCNCWRLRFRTIPSVCYIYRHLFCFISFFEKKMQDKEIRKRLQDSEFKLGSSMPLDEAKGRASQLEAEVTSLERYIQIVIMWSMFIN